MERDPGSSMDAGHGLCHGSACMHATACVCGICCLKLLNLRLQQQASAFHPAIATHPPTALRCAALHGPHVSSDAEGGCAQRAYTCAAGGPDNHCSPLTAMP